MRSILIICFEFPPGPGGIGQHAYSIAYELAKSNHAKVHVLTSADYASKKECNAFDALNSSIQIRRIKGGSFANYLKRIIACVAVVSAANADQIILSGKAALWLAPLVWMAKSRRSKTICFLHGSEVRLPGRFQRELTYFSLASIDTIYCVSMFTKNLLPEKVLKKREILILPNGINLTEFPASLPAPLPEIATIGNPSLLTVGQVSKRKGQHRVMAALPYLLKKWPALHYHMVGMATAKNDIVALGSFLQLEHAHYSFHGRIPSREILFQIYTSVDIFIMLSENQPNGDVEGFGIAILEANYFGVPAIGAKGCGIEDAIEDGVNGYLVDGNDHVAISFAIEKCIKNREALGRSAREWARKFDWKILIDQISEQKGS